jgi:hypothetical protein
MGDKRSIVEQYAHTTLGASAKAMCLAAKTAPAGIKLMFVSKDNRIVGAGAGTATPDAFTGAACNVASLAGADVLANITFTTGAYRALTGEPGTRRFKSLLSLNAPNRVQDLVSIAQSEGCAITVNPDLADSACLILPTGVTVPRLDDQARLEAGRPLTELQQSSAYLAWAVQASSPGCSIAIVNKQKLVGFSYMKESARAARQAVAVAATNRNFLGGSVAWVSDLKLKSLQTLAEAGVSVVIAPASTKSKSLDSVADERRIKLYLI